MPNRQKLPPQLLDFVIKNGSSMIVMNMMKITGMSDSWLYTFYRENNIIPIDKKWYGNNRRAYDAKEFKKIKSELEPVKIPIQRPKAEYSNTTRDQIINKYFDNE